MALFISPNVPMYKDLISARYPTSSSSIFQLYMESKKKNKNENIEMEIKLIVARREVGGSMGEKVKGNIVDNVMFAW